MSKSVKYILISAGVCVLGAILLDCGIDITGWTLVTLGVFGVLMGPVAAQL